MNTPSRRRTVLAAAIVSLTALSAAVTTTEAAAIALSFSGGGGTPLTMTLAQPVTFTITAAPAFGILFDFENVGTFLSGAFGVSGTMTYTINGGAPITFNIGSNNDPGTGTIAPADYVLRHNPVSPAALGNVVVLSPGSITTAINVPGATPATGTYSVILVDANGAEVAVVPEPAALSLLAFGGLCCLARRRRTA